MPKRGDKSRGSVVPRQASWLLVLRAARDRHGRCWLRVRLPARPNDAAAWVDANRVVLEPTRWRLVISRAARTICIRLANRAIEWIVRKVGADELPGIPVRVR